MIVAVTIRTQGILYSGREELPRARAFLLAALRAHELLSHHRLLDRDPAAEPPRTAAFREPLQGPYTHTLFYLAQVYGAMGDAKTSASYCYRTLAEQVHDLIDASSFWHTTFRFRFRVRPRLTFPPSLSPTVPPPFPLCARRSWRGRFAWTGRAG